MKGVSAAYHARCRPFDVPLFDLPLSYKQHTSVYLWDPTEETQVHKPLVWASSKD